MGRRHAILIASSSFPKAKPDLDDLVAPERDVAALSEVLAQQHAGGFEVETLCNRPSQEVRERINLMLHEAAKDDVLLVYFSGHGKLDVQGRLCLAMTDTQSKLLASTTFRINELRDYIDNAYCKNVILVLDCCHSGAASKSWLAKGGAVAEQLERLAEGGGIHIMSAAGKDQTALESQDTGQSVFTRHLVEGLRSGAADINGDGVITFDELYEYVRSMVVREGHQRPERSLFSGQGSVVIAQTGRDRRVDRVQRLRRGLHELSEARHLPLRHFAEALQVLDVPRLQAGPWDDECLALIEGLVERTVALGEFINRWEPLWDRRPGAPSATISPTFASKSEPSGSVAPEVDVPRAKDVA